MAPAGGLRARFARLAAGLGAASRASNTQPPQHSQTRLAAPGFGAQHTRLTRPGPVFGPRD
eukprot:9413759-Lingulodinium_polyedra.AAC.1